MLFCCNMHMKYFREQLTKFKHPVQEEKKRQKGKINPGSSFGPKILLSVLSVEQTGINPNKPAPSLSNKNYNTVNNLFTFLIKLMCLILKMFFKSYLSFIRGMGYRALGDLPFRC